MVCVTRHVIHLGSHDIFLAEVVATHADESVLNDKNKVMIDKVKPYAFCYNIQEYWSLKELIGHYGWSKPELDKDLEKLSTKGIGSTTIYYRGTPGEIRKRGGGKLVQLEGAAAGVSPGAPSRQGVATRRPVTEEAVEEEIPDEEVIEEGVEEEEEPVTLPVRRN